MKTKLYSILLAAMMLSVVSFLPAGQAGAANNTLQSTDDDAEVRYANNAKRLPNQENQRRLRETEAWKNFRASHGNWYVEFNEITAMPHRAAGNPIATFGTSPEARALNFIGTNLNAFNVPMTDLKLMRVYIDAKSELVDYYQTYQDLKVIGSHIPIRMRSDHKVVMFGIETFDNISVNIFPTISAQAIVQYAQNGITDNIVSTVVEPELKILPIIGNGGYTFHLVYELMVETEGNMPGKYFTWVDAHDGKVLYRQNQVHTFMPETPPPPPAITVTINGTVTHNPMQPTTVEGMPFQRVIINAVTNYTDANGVANTGDNVTVSASYSMRGTRARVFYDPTNQIASFNGILNPGNNTVSWNTNALDVEVAGFYQTNSIWSHMDANTPAGFTLMDGVMDVYVDVAGDCNAFYNGDINFYAAEIPSGCPAIALFNDVVFHEYGHGINYRFYQYYTGNPNYFQNGALGEGYSDLWGLTLTDYPILAEGWNGTPNSNIRRYDINPKIYPQDLVGQVHADGEIICGAFWDTYQNLGNLQLMIDIWIGSQSYISMAANGQEGQLYRDILLDALLWDDINNGGDGDITNGTPNDADICNGFGQHGITLISNISVSHSPVLASTENIPVTIDVTLSGTNTYLGDVFIYYKINMNPAWNPVVMTNTGGNNYSGDIPGQLSGTLISYYVGAEDNLCGYLSSIKPAGANLSNPNIPYFVLVDYNLMETEDFDGNSFSGSWTYGLPGDDATTGMWELNMPEASIGTGGDTVQPGVQHTPGGVLCALTENGPFGGSIGQNDVDGGLTTLETPTLDLAQYDNPAITYYRWYINDPPGGANPGNDWLIIHLSNDGGSNWTAVETTNVSDKSWRRFAFRVSDYVTPTGNMKIRFYASDSLLIGQGLPFDGGSIVEFALDDIQIWDSGPLGVDENTAGGFELNVYPNPAKDYIKVEFNLTEQSEVSLQITNYLGEVVYKERLGNQLPGAITLQISAEALSSGTYFLNFIAGDESRMERITILK